MTPAERRRRWAYGYISRASTPGPSYGSKEWLAMPEGPEKWACVVRAAECWATDGDDLLERLQAEVDLSRAAHKAAEDAEYVARRDAHRADWTGRGFRADPGIADDLDREWREWSGGVAG